ncbi:MAG: M48 family metalloprotease [Thermodesulfobacteriota bacterium]|nr:M48 family metalloprotease [Thermodesulfobacteriota bacterium]
MKIVVVAFVVTALSLLPIHSSAVSHPSLTTAEEEELGEEFMRYLEKRCTLIEDAAIVDYVNEIGQGIVRQHASPPFAFRFYLVHEDVYNAFASPAGHVFIYSGLLAAMEREEELAGILAHEVAHVFCRHISERMEQSKKISLMTLAGILTGVFIGGSPEVASAITSSSIAAGQALSLKYSREDEREADQVGLKYLSKAGYSGEGLLSMLQKIRAKHWFGSEQIPSYVTTHPAIEERIAYLDTWIQTHPEWKGHERPKDQRAFRKVQTRLTALYTDAAAARSTFGAELRKDSEDALGYYGLGLVYGREGEKEKAVANLKRALQLRPLDADILKDLGKTYFQMGDYDNAVKALLGVLASNASDREARFFLGRSQMERGDLVMAAETFQEMAGNHADDLPVDYYLGETFGKLGNEAEAHFRLGLHYKKKEDLKNALFHLRRALAVSAKDPARQEEIKGLLKGLRALSLEQQKE